MLLKKQLAMLILTILVFLTIGVFVSAFVSSIAKNDSLLVKQLIVGDEIVIYKDDDLYMLKIVKTDHDYVDLYCYWDGKTRSFPFQYIGSVSYSKQEKDYMLLRSIFSEYEKIIIYKPSLETRFFYFLKVL